MRQPEVTDMNELIRRAVLALAVVLGTLTGASYLSVGTHSGLPTMTPAAVPLHQIDAPRTTGSMLPDARTPMPRAGYP